MASSGGSGASGSGGSVNKVGLLLTAGAGLLLIMGGAIIVNDPEPADPEPVPTAQAAATATAMTSSQPTQPRNPPPLFDRNTLRGRDPNAIIITVAGYGLPARVGIQAANDDEVLARGAFDPAQGVERACKPQTQLPGPCISYMVVKRGASVTVTAGDARAGNWPALDYLRGAGCDIVGDGKDHTCRVTLGADADLEARFYGSESPGTKFQYPTCPPRVCR